MSKKKISFDESRGYFNDTFCDCSGIESIQKTSRQFSLIPHKFRSDLTKEPYEGECQLRLKIMVKDTSSRPQGCFLTLKTATSIVTG